MLHGDLPGPPLSNTVHSKKDNIQKGQQTNWGEQQGMDIFWSYFCKLLDDELISEGLSVPSYLMS